MKYVAIDIETNGLTHINGIIWGIGVNDGKKVQVLHDCKGGAGFFNKIKTVLENPEICKVIHNAAFDCYMIEMLTGIKIRNVWDTMLCEVVIQGLQIPKDSKDKVLAAKHSSALEFTLPRYGFKSPDKSITKQFINRPRGIKFKDSEIEYIEGDVKYLLALQRAQEFLLTRDGQLEVALLENKCVEKIIQMKVAGIGWDAKTWLQIAEDNEKQFKARMAKLPRQVSNWNSPKQVKDFFKNRGVMISGFKEIDKVYLATRDELLGNFIVARELHKSVVAYGKNWFTDNFCDPDGRIRCGVQQIINTGRMSMMNPNLTQLPGDGSSKVDRARILELVLQQTKQPPQHRKAFVPKPGYKFVIGDFSGQEMGVMAAGSNEDLWIDAMLRGDDIHAITASLLYASEWAQGAEKGCKFPKKCECKGHKKLRSPTKILNFMLAYGGGPTKFSDSTGVNFEEAKKIIAKYRKVVARLTMWLNLNAREALKTGVSYSSDPYKRRRVLRGVEDWQIENQGKNNPIQAAGANMLKLAMISLPEEYTIVLVIHDEIIIECKKSEASKCAKVLKKVMEDSATFITGIDGLIKVTPKISDNLLK